MICYVVPIYAHKGKPLEYYINYVQNPAKVLPETDPALHNLQNQLPDTVLQEILTTEDGQAIPVYASAYMTTPEELVERVEYLQEVYQSYHGDARGMDGPIAYHIIVSAAPAERASDQEVHLIAVELAEELGAYPGVIATHIKPVWDERLNIWRGLVKHSHLVVSAFPDTVHEMPKKLNLGYRHKHLREISDRIAIEHGLQILVDADHGKSDSYYAVMQGKKGASWMEAAREALSEAVAAAKDRGDYESKVAEAGYGLQQIGRDFLYTTTGGHQVMGRKLGRAFTAERLETRWAAEREGAIDMELEKAALKNKLLYVHLPLGGRFKDAKARYRCNLQTLMQTYSEDTLQSYFQRGCMYDITDEEGNRVCRAEGQQILDYLGVGDAWERGRELPLEVRQRRLEWHLDRVRKEADRTCERQTESAALRYEYRCARMTAEDIEREQKWWDRYLESMKPRYVLADWAQALPETCIIILMIIECLSPYREESIFVEVCPERPAIIGGSYSWHGQQAQRTMDAITIAQDHGIHSIAELEVIFGEAQSRYDRLAKELAEVNLQLEDIEPIIAAVRRCQKARSKFDACSARVSSYAELLRTDPNVARAYESSVRAVGKETVEQWGSIERICLHYDMLKAKRPMLLQAVAAEYERLRKLELVSEVTRLESIRAQMMTERDVETQSEVPARKPSIDELIKGATPSSDAPPRPQTKSLDLEH